ncbi:MAG: phosphatidylserine decarboxylase family protein [Syntrophobacterales bacterium]|nr:phosphatidylserine decarboxylase family protein [Syntrophobacterales bacterium]
MKESLIAKEGLRFLIPSFALFIFFTAFHYRVLALACFLFVMFSVFFFRNPKRVTVDEAGTIISPADGKVVEVRDVFDSEFLGEKRKRIGIFMSPVDVHVNRAPASGRVSTVRHRSGEFAMAFKQDVDQVNERNYILIGSGSDAVLMVQIAGFLARRITCYVKGGDEVKKGQPVGIISFGSRVDVYLPKEYEPMVDLQERVRAGVTILARKGPIAE